MFNKERFDAIIHLSGEKMIGAAEVMGISVNTLYAKRRGDTDFTNREIEAFCRHFMVSPMDVFFEGLEQDLRAGQVFEALAEDLTKARSCAKEEEA